MHGLGNGCSSHLVLRGLLRDGPADLLPAPVVGRIVLAEHGLAQDPGLGAQDLVAVDGQQRGAADDLRAVGLALEYTHGRGPGVVLWSDGHLHATLELEDEVGARERAAVDLRGVIWDLPGQQPVKALRHLTRGPDQRGARVRDGRALAILTQGQGLPSHRDAQDLDLPEAELRLVYRHPLELGGHAPGVVAAERDLARDAVGPRQEVSETILRQAVQLRKLAEKTELGVDREGCEAEAKDAVELEGVEGLLRELSRRDHADAHTLLAGLRLEVSGMVAQADGLADECTGDLSSAIGDVDLVTLRSIRNHLSALVVQVHCRERGCTVVTVVLQARLRLAPGGRQEEVAGAGVEDHGEALLRRQAEEDLAEVRRLVRDDFVIPDNWHILLVQRDRHDGPCDGDGSARDRDNCGGVRDNRGDEEGGKQGDCTCREHHEIGT
mmetsp:Transcript_44809/g.143532  ORF Transcript_44809/g.143532 Transcript_44809/m.143532 type:complete len:439 (+) Transcript_44809:148-1464(+)